MKLRYRPTAFGLALILSMGSTVSVAAADDAVVQGRPEVFGDRPTNAAEPADGLTFEVSIDRPLVMLGDEIVVEAEYKVRIDDEHDEHDDSDAEGDEGTEEGAVDDETSSTATSDSLPTSVVFSVDHGDGTVVELGVDEVESDEEEFEAETEGDPYVYAAEGTYTVTVTATPDVGEAETATLDVTVTTDPVAYGRGIGRSCPNADGDDDTDDDADEEDLDTVDGDVAPETRVETASFVDVSGSAHERAIMCLAARGIVTGRSATDFAPGAPVTREQVATLLSNVLADAGVELPAAALDAFGDDDGSVHEDAVNQLAELGLIGGVSADEFAPKAPLTRGQMASLLVRLYAVATGSELDAELDYFTDDDGSVHEASVNASAAAGIALGREHRKFAGGDEVTRAQLATFLARLLDILAEEGENVG